jgi:DNA topoisomerase-6 subunit B
MDARQRHISVSEFFTKNRHLLGFDNPRKALLTCVKEAVDNALDAAEEAGILPEVVVTLEVAPANGEAPPPASQATRFRVTVIDNGPGIVRQRIGRTNATSAGAAGVRPGPGAPGGGSAMAASRGRR